jgi:putative oxygen-independent coproporphyrinogen III oxidase
VSALIAAESGGLDATVASGVLPALGLYIHLPWCVSKCPYCDFNSHAVRDALPEARYIDALIADLAVQAPRVRGREVSSVFMGGGTPSLFSPAALGRLLEAARKLVAITADAEITLEANPATVERGRFAEYRAAGINRVSLGAQSFNSETLRALGRIHQPADVFRAVEELHTAGLTNFNLDLMFALPAQTVAGAVADVTIALSLQPTHLSHYQLTLEPGTLFAAQPPPLPDDDVAWAMQSECHALLAARGYSQYEVSAFARSGRQCHHNLNYWNYGDYLGIGAGAHGKLTRIAAASGSAQAGTLRIERSTHLREPRRYLAAAGGGPEWRTVPAQDLPFEFMMNALRLRDGFAPELFAVRTGLQPSAVTGLLERLAADGLMEFAAGHWRASARGYIWLNELVQRFLPERNSSIRASS